MSDPTGAPVDRLSERQKECLRLIVRGYQSDKDIAVRLGISPETVKQHIAAARRTLGVPTRSQAARLLAAHDVSTARSTDQTHENLWESIPPPDGVNPSTTLVQQANIDAVPVAGRTWRRRLGPFGWLVPAYRGASNDLRTGQRILLLILLPLAIILVTVGALSAVETLTRLLARLTA